jgi:hypothetical protein
MLVLPAIPIVRLETLLRFVEQASTAQLRKDTGRFRLRDASEHERGNGYRRQFAIMLRSNAQHVHPLLEKLGR